VLGGPERGQRVRLSEMQREIVRRIYDDPKGLQSEPVNGLPLAAYALLHVCGPEALQREFVPEIDADIFSVWNATGPDLKAVLKREGGRIVCPELETRYPAAA
jgi:hypothetical protein